MAYFLHFYAVPQDAAAPPELTPEEVPEFMRSNGTEVGDLEFPPGQSLLLLEALAAVTGAPVSALLLGPFRGLTPTPQSPPFGGFTVDEGAAIMEALRHFLTQPETYVPELQEAEETFAISPPELLDLAARLSEALEQCLNAGGEPAAYYD